MALEAFIQAFDNRGLRRYFLAAPPVAVAKAVQRADNFRGIESSQHSRVNAVQDNSSKATEANDPHGEMLTTLLGYMKQQKTLLEQLAARTKPPLQCYKCQGAHVRRNCPKLKSGNKKRPVVITV